MSEVNKLLQHGKKSTGGISHVLLPIRTDDSTTYNYIQDKTQLNNIILQPNIAHFNQACNTPFAQQTMINILGENGYSDTSINILAGIVPHDIPKHPKLLLSQLTQARQTVPLDMLFHDMCTGFLKWRENTTTLPSGKHIGIYQALIKAMKFNICTESEIKY
jgi:hypothetical protein